MPELDAYYPSASLGELHHQYSTFPPEIQSVLSTATYNQLNDINGLDDFPEKFAHLLDCFGHLGDCGNDFSIPPWRETPDVLLRMVTDFNPSTQTQAKKIRLCDLKANHQLTPIFMLIYRQVRKYLFLREKASNLYTRGKVIYRYYYLALGQQFVNSGFIDEPDDIFYLIPRQVESIVSENQCEADYKDIITQHKQEMQRLNDIQMPTVIYGEKPPPISQANTRIMAGISTSMGVYSGHVCVVKSFQDFPKLKQGDVLVIPYSDVSWAPLFARAGALISEAGGMLSHGSIVAREYNIPAIVSVEMATQIPDGTLVTVDAQRGLVLINELIQND
jgi:pyruvate,water dikinase